MDTAKPAITIERFTDALVELEDGTELPLRFTPFTRQQFVAFMDGFSAIENPPSAAAIYRKAGEEGLPWHLVRAARLAEMTPEQREAHQALERSEADQMLAFCAQHITAYVRVQPDAPTIVVVEADGTRREVRTGEDLAREFSGDPMALGTIVRRLAEENALSAQKKTNSRRRFASSPSSSAPPTAAPGSAPAPIAAPVVENPASATSADASALPDLSLSSVTE